MKDNKCNNWNCILNEDGEKCVSGNCNNCHYREIREKGVTENEERGKLDD